MSFYQTKAGSWGEGMYHELTHTTCLPTQNHCVGTHLAQMVTVKFASSFLL